MKPCRAFEYHHSCPFKQAHASQHMRHMIMHDSCWLAADMHHRMQCSNHGSYWINQANLQSKHCHAIGSAHSHPINLGGDALCHLGKANHPGSSAHLLDSSISSRADEFFPFKRNFDAWLPSLDLRVAHRSCSQWCERCVFESLYCRTGICHRRFAARQLGCTSDATGGRWATLHLC